MNRVKETAKSILIVLLMLSAIYLTARTWVYDASMLPEPLYNAASGFMGFFGVDLSAYGTVRVETNPSQNLEAAARPIRCAVTLEDGRYGAEYDQTAVDMILAGTLDLVGKGIGSALAPTEISRLEWRSALMKIGVYYDYYGTIPLSAIALWQNYEPPAELAARARRILLAVEDDGVGLYYADEKTGLYYRCGTAVEREDLLALIDGFQSNGCMFAFERPDLSAKPMDDLFLFDWRPSLREAEIRNPGADSQVFNALLESFGISLSTKRITQQNGSLMAIEGARDLVLTSDGAAIYTDSLDDPDREYRIYFPQVGTTDAELIERLRALAAATAGKVCGDASVSLREFELNRETGECVVRFGYVLAGVPVLLSDSPDAAEFRIENGVLTYARISLRTFALGDEKLRPMPAETAVLLAGKELGADFELGVCYCEEDGGLRVGWYGKSGDTTKNVR